MLELPLHGHRFIVESNHNSNSQRTVPPQLIPKTRTVHVYSRIAAITVTPHLPVQRTMEQRASVIGAQ